MPASLPQGWTSSTVGELFPSFGGGTPNRGTPSYWKGDIPWLSSGDIKTAIIAESSETITKLGLEESSARLCRKGSVIVVVRSGILKHTLPVAVLGRDAAINQDIKCFDSGDDQLNRWLALAWRASAQMLLAQNREGTTVQSVKFDTLRDFVLPVPPPDEQRRIVAKVEKLLARTEASRQRLAKIPILLKRLRQSILAAACSGRLTADWREQNQGIKPVKRLGIGNPPPDFCLPPTWNWLLSAHAFEYVTSGSRGWARYYSDKGALFIRVGNLNHDAIELDLKSIQRVSPQASAEGRRTKVAKGDILVSITADVGMVALVEPGIEEAYINQHVAIGRPAGNIDRKYLAYFLAAKNGGQEQFLNLQHGATKVGLGLDDIRSIWIAAPPFAEQQEIVRRIEKLLKITDLMEERYKKVKAYLGIIGQSILAKAFHGKLVVKNSERVTKSKRRSHE